MSLNANLHTGSLRSTLLATTTITAAVSGTTTTPITGLGGMWYVGAEGIFVYGSGGTTAKFWLQTSMDGGASWFDIMNFAYTTASLNKVGACSGNAGFTPATPTDATLADNTVNQGLLGDRLRVKYTTTGTYAGGTTISIYAHVKG